ncbi:hypothetical protein AG1IA_09651 [Rhizoctonia solani AG-1 IA]|uniref:Uncharacterized protein n=1 Tax=Thanatephorus cucumeris (strain AG1-IA) TaxID=983506 RepID=L8WIZ9_THACA|nr:hypothetical protein AG1IA_09651 [Rhizoctonia solani AG-1 IA]
MVQRPGHAGSLMAWGDRVISVSTPLHWLSCPIKLDGTMEVLSSCQSLFSIDEKICYDTLGADSVLVYYYQLAVALIHGSYSNRRPSLPTELVLHIFYFARLVSPRPSPFLSKRYTCARPVPPPLYHGFFRLTRLPLSKAPLVRTPKLDFSGKREVGKIGIVVRYAGDDIQWSEFCLRIVRSNQHDTCTRSDGFELFWPCFDSTSLVSCQDGGRRVVDKHDDIWRYLLHGDQIEVAVQTYAGEIQVDKFDAVVRVYEQWEPELEILARL